MNKLLLLAYFFPPCGNAGTQRPAKFCKHLPSFGWEPTAVVPVLDESAGQLYRADNTLIPDIAQTRVVRVPGRDGSWGKALPRIDLAHWWLEAGYEAGADLLRREDFDAVLVTMSPFDLSYIGRRLQKEFRVPVVYDLRDPWAIDGWRYRRTYFDWRRDYNAMAAALSTADGVVANTPESARALAAAVPGLDPAKMATIPNGFDEDDFADACERPAGLDAAAFHLVHVGTLHSQMLYEYEGLKGRLKRLLHYYPEPIDPSGRTPLHLLRAVRMLRKQGHPLAARLRIVLVGGVDAATERCVRESGVGDVVKVTGRVPHAESVRWMRWADALFLPLHGLPAGRRSLIVPGKTYEYLATGRPILGCLPPGDARDFVSDSGRGFCADPCRPAEIAEAIGRLYDAARSRTIEETEPPRQFARRELTRAMARFLNEVAGRDGGTARPALPAEATAHGA
jgi:glycosyltransferase involved in cell wall biosynthesis